MLNGIEENGYEFFFVKAKDGHFSAAVLRMAPDQLHWYVSESHRGKHLLVEPLKKIILPFIFHYHKTKTQSATIERLRTWAMQSTKLAIKTGFMRISTSEDKEIYQISCQDVPKYRPMRGKSGDPAELDEMKSQAKIGGRFMHMALDVLKVRYSGHVDSEKIGEISSTISDAQMYLLAAIEDAKFSIEKGKGSQ